MKKQRSESGKAAGMQRREAVILAACVAFSIMIHAISIIDGFGEPDAARLATIATEWHNNGTISDYSYALRTSPLYIHALKISLGLGIPLHIIPSLMNWFNIIVGALTIFPLYFLWKRFSNASVAAIACLFFFVTPAFWLANIYGMPHLPSFALFISSLLLFSYGLDQTRRMSNACIAGCTLLAVLSMTLKADIILCFFAYLGIAISLHTVNKRTVTASLLIPLVALLAVIFYAKLLIPRMPSFAGSVDTWTASFPFTMQALTDSYNRMIPVRTTGIFLFGTWMLSIFYLLFRRRHMRSVVFCLMWACPLLLFWGLKMGNSARHMMAASCPLLFIASLAALDLFKSSRSLLIFVAVALVGNYFVSYEGSSISPDARLHRLTASSRHFAKVRHSFAGDFADVVAVEKKAYIGSTSIPYVEWAVFLRCKAFRLVRENPKEYQLSYGGNHTQYFQILTVKGPVTLGPSSEWFMFTLEPDITILQHPKWIKHMKDNPYIQIESVEK